MMRRTVISPNSELNMLEMLDCNPKLAQQPILSMGMTHVARVPTLGIFLDK